jgi:multidrug efflux system membrane fusion protein
MVPQAREKDARDSLDDTYLRAPFSGVVGTVYVENHEDVRAKQPIASLQDLSGLDILIDVPEMLMARGTRDTHVEAYATFAAAREREFPLTLKEFTTEADPLTQTYRITFRMDPPSDLVILPGMTTTVFVRRVLDEAPEGQIQVPALAVVSDGAGQAFVWVVDTDAMTVHKRPVTTGEPTGTEEIVIREGLKPGETLAVSAVSRLTEGLKVRKLEQ